MEIFDIEFDNVVKSVFSSGKTTYALALDWFYPQIDRYYAQRKRLNEDFYEKLERDIPNGCIMPPITIALVTKNLENLKTKQPKDIELLIADNKESLYILDGIQRLNTLKRAFNENINNYKLYFNILIAESEDRLLYRMITLNNGQKPMSARHQIEVLAHNIFDFDSLGIPLQTEKGRSKKIIKGSFNKDDIIKGYISYLSESVNIDNQKIIESKMDELIAEKIIKSTVTQGDFSFQDVMDLVGKFVDDEYLLKWFKQTNNMIGFCAGISKSYKSIDTETVEDFKSRIEKYEKSFESFDISKIKLGYLRRLTVNYYISKYENLKDSTISDLEDSLSQASMLFM